MIKLNKRKKVNGTELASSIIEPLMNWTGLPLFLGGERVDFYTSEDPGVLDNGIVFTIPPAAAGGLDIYYVVMVKNSDTFSMKVCRRDEQVSKSPKEIDPHPQDVDILSDTNNIKPEELHDTWLSILDIPLWAEVKPPHRVANLRKIATTGVRYSRKASNVLGTPIAKAAVFNRHLTGDWGSFDEESAKEQDTALGVGGAGEVASIFDYPKGSVVVVTDLESMTTDVLTEKEYYA